MAVSRRLLLLAAVSAPVLALAGRAIDMVTDAVTGAASASRPSPDGTSATRCAQCGAPDHTMLDVACPLAPRVLA